MNISKLTLCALMLLTVGTAAKAQMSAHDYNSPVGWGTVGGTITGGNDEGAIKVTTMSELKTALVGTYKHTIYIEGEIDITGLVSMENVQNKTIYGLPGSALVNSIHSTDVKKSGILSFKNSKNIIIRNVTFKSAGAFDIDGNDNLNLTNCSYVWVDHCDFQDGVDGNFDCNNGSDHIMVPLPLSERALGGRLRRIGRPPLQQSLGRKRQRDRERGQAAHHILQLLVGRGMPRAHAPHTLRTGASAQLPLLVFRHKLLRRNRIQV